MEEDRFHFVCIDCISKVQSWFDFYQQIINSFKIGHLVIQEIENQNQDGIGSSNSGKDIYFVTTNKEDNTIKNLSPKNVINCESEIIKSEYENINFYDNVQFQNLVHSDLIRQDRETSEESRNFECEKCNKKFKHVQTLNEHMKRHYNLKNFACSLCGKSFYKKFNVLEHMRIHTGERPFKCEFCIKTFTRTLLLRNHIKKVPTSIYRSKISIYRGKIY